MRFHTNRGILAILGTSVPDGESKKWGRKILHYVLWSCSLCGYLSMYPGGFPPRWEDGKSAFWMPGIGSRGCWDDICNKVKVPRQELCLWGIIQLLCCNMLKNIKCSKLDVFLVLRNPHPHLLCQSDIKNEIVRANFKCFAEGILHLIQILRKRL